MAAARAAERLPCRRTLRDGIAVAAFDRRRACTRSTRLAFLVVFM
jgi:hypothetical protein